MKKDKNIIIEDFGNEWEKFDQINLINEELDEIFNDYFDIFPWEKIGKKSIGIDFGCGTGRWAKIVAPKCKSLTLLDASTKSINVSKKMLNKFENVNFLVSDVTNTNISNKKYDFAYSLGVLHHVPNIDMALKEVNRILKQGSPFLIYLYYSFENKPKWYVLLWEFSNFLRKIISHSPKSIKMFVSEIIAHLIYLPLSRLSLVLEKLNINVSNVPLSYYRNKSLYTMRTDSLDRFGTTYEKRYSKKEIIDLLTSNGFTDIEFSAKKPFWCAIAYKI